MSAAVDVSVVIPAFNAARTIAEAIASIAGGSRRPREILVVDDRCTDGTGPVAAACDRIVRVLPSHGLGAACARNTGARAAQGEWLAFLDADDLWQPNRLELGLDAAVGAHRDAAVFGRIRQFFDPSLGRTDRPEPELSDACHPNTLLIRRKAFLDEGGFDPESGIAEIVEWFASRCDAGRPFVRIPEVMALRRIHGENVGVRCADRRGDYVRMAKALLDRRRARSGA